MELTGRRLRTLWRKTARPIYPVDQRLVDVASRASPENGDIYSQIQNPTSYQVYRYLAEFTARTTEARSGKPLQGLRILDWGGGKGYLTYFLKQLGAEVTLYETDDFDHRALWRKFGLDTITSADGMLPFPDQTFDAIAGLGVLEHVPYDYEWLKEVNRVLKADGLFFCFNLPNKTGYMHKLAWLRGIRYHDRLYTRREVTGLLKRAGFNTVGRPWFRQLLPKNHIRYRYPRLFERLDLLATNYTPLCFLASSVEFVARKQHTYTAQH